VRFDVETSRRRRTIEVQRSGQGWTVVVDGKVLSVDLARSGDRWSLLVDKSSYEFAIQSRGPGAHLVHVDGHAVPVTVLSPGKRRSGGGSGTTAATGPIAVVAPMPGRVIKVLVKAGDKVAARQGLVVVEAMKMENELRAPRAGTVAELRVREGAPVEANVVLVVIT
jgi:biotin carboxyl carrier protein